MLTKITGIVIQSISHNDRNNVVTLFTRQRGRMAFIVPAGNSKSARLTNSRLAPLSLIEAEINLKSSRNLQYLGKISSPRPWRTIYFDPMKSISTIFLSEFLNNLLRNSEAPDEALWQFIFQAIRTLDNISSGLPNYHIAFLIRLLPFVGIFPDRDSFLPGRIFNMQEGLFSDHPPLNHKNWIMPDEAALIPLLLRIDFNNLHLFRLNVSQRRRILALLLRYYSLHIPIKEDMKSIDILREILE